MSEALWLAAGAALSLLGMAWLALAMETHWAQAMRRPAKAAVATRRVLRTGGSLTLALSLLACLMADRPSMAALVWMMYLAGSAALVAMSLAHRPRLLARLWPPG
jgi:hypothetical protein